MFKESLPRLACLLLLLAVAGCSLGGQKAKQADIHYMLGLSNLGDQDATSALRELLQAAELDPQRADIQSALGQAYFQKQAYPEAEQHFLEAIRLDPQNPQYQNNLGALYLSMQRWDDAIKHFLKASRNLLFATPEVALTGAGFANFQKGDYANAISLYREAMARDPNYAQAYLRLGEVYYAQDQTAQAVKEYGRALELFPQYVEAHYRLGVAYLKQQQPAKARTEFLAVVKAAPNSEFARLSNNYLKQLK